MMSDEEFDKSLDELKTNLEFFQIVLNEIEAEAVRLQLVTKAMLDEETRKLEGLNND